MAFCCRLIVCLAVAITLWESLNATKCSKPSRIANKCNNKSIFLFAFDENGTVTNVTITNNAAAALSKKNAFYSCKIHHHNFNRRLVLSRDCKDEEIICSEGINIVKKTKSDCVNEIRPTLHPDCIDSENHTKCNFCIESGKNTTWILSIDNHAKEEMPFSTCKEFLRTPRVNTSGPFMEKIKSVVAEDIVTTFRDIYSS
eukprot:m.782 g.782  ORF g.782 m.782 type:complete len:200 (+) comp4851_c0_seq1:50-649(+)